MAISLLHAQPRANQVPFHYAMLAESEPSRSLEAASARLSRVQADLRDPAAKVSDAATSGMLAEEDHAMMDVALAPPRSLKDLQIKMQAVLASVPEDGALPKRTAMLLAAVVSDIDMLLNRPD